jgi:predicted nucleotidyltransferase
MSSELDTLPPDARAHLATFKREVEEALPGRVARMALFGSRARGEAEEDSDYDVAVFVRNLEDRTAVSDVVSDLAYPHVLEGIYISPIVLPEDYLDSPRGRTALAADIAKEGIVLP